MASSHTVNLSSKNSCFESCDPKHVLSLGIQYRPGLWIMEFQGDWEPGFGSLENAIQPR